MARAETWLAEYSNVGFCNVSLIAHVIRQLNGLGQR